MHALDSVIHSDDVKAAKHDRPKGADHLTDDVIRDRLAAVHIERTLDRIQRFDGRRYDASALLSHAAALGIIGSRVLPPAAGADVFVVVAITKDEPRLARIEGWISRRSLGDGCDVAHLWPLASLLRWIRAGFPPLTR